MDHLENRPEFVASLVDQKIVIAAVRVGFSVRESFVLFDVIVFRLVIRRVIVLLVVVVVVRVVTAALVPSWVPKKVALTL